MAVGILARIGAKISAKLALRASARAGARAGGGLLARTTARLGFKSGALIGLGGGLAGLSLLNRADGGDGIFDAINPFNGGSSMITFLIVAGGVLLFLSMFRR